MKRALLRDRILIILSSVAAAAIVIAMSADFQANSTLRVDAIDHTVVDPTSETFSLQFLGDTMLGHSAQPLVDEQGYGFPLSGVAPLLDGDFVVANAESPMSVRSNPLNPGKEYSYNANPLAAAALKNVGVDAVGLGNNHSMDLGLPGLRDTVRYAATTGLLSFGAGANRAEAERPLLVRSDLGVVGIVALGENFGRATRAEPDHPGVVVFTPQSVQRGVDLARAAGADWVVAYVHWGNNYADTNDEQRYWARMLVDAGYDLIVGTGPHSSAPIEFIGSVPVAYSIGNFVFGATGRFESFGKVGIGLILTVELSRTSAARLVVKCIVTDNKVIDYVPQPCSEAETLAIMPTINPSLVPQGTSAYLPCNCFRPPAKDD